MLGLDPIRSSASRWPFELAQSIGLAVLYFVLGRLSLFFVIQPEGLALFWPPSGFMLAVLLLAPRRRWPMALACVFVASAAANLAGGNPGFVSLGFAFANLVEPVVVASLLVHVVGVPLSMNRLRDVVGLTLVGCGAGAALAATVGAAVPAIGFGARYTDVWLVWWISDGIGMLIVTPVVLTLAADPGALRRATWRQAAEAISLSAAVVTLTVIIFGGDPSHRSIAYQEYLVMPLLLWAALRFGPRGAALTLLVLVTISVSLTVRGFGVFGAHVTPLKEHVLGLQLFLGIVGVTSLSLAAILAERRRAEKELRESEMRYRALVAQAADGIFIMSLEGKILEVNDAFARQHGHTPEELLDLGLVGLGVEDAETIHGRITRILAGESLTFEVEHRRKDGTALPMEVTTSLVDLGDRKCIMAFHRDITERRLAEAEKQALQDQLLQARKMESVGRLAGGVAHDFNNMLGVILGHVELALEDVTAAHPLHSDLEGIRNAANRSADLTRQLLAFARKQTIAPIVLDLNETVAGMLRMLKRFIGEDIHLDWKPGIDLWPVKMDPVQIDQILANLSINARDAIGGVGTVTIETKNVTRDGVIPEDDASFVPDDYVVLAVGDSGCGMDRETLANVFEPFFTTKDLGKGTGLGLATVYGIVKQNNGFIYVHSEPGTGTIFAIYLPRCAGTTSRVSVGPPADVSLRGDETVLVVEDEREILDLSRIMLERMGYTVLVAGTPGEALRLADQHAGRIHLLMTDVVMPEMNGRDLANRLHALYPEIKQLFMSGYTADVIADHGVLDERVHFIQKPFSTRDLAVKVREVLGRG